MYSNIVGTSRERMHSILADDIAMRQLSAHWV